MFSTLLGVFIFLLCAFSRGEDGTPTYVVAGYNGAGCIGSASSTRKGAIGDCVLHVFDSSLSARFVSVSDGTLLLRTYGTPDCTGSFSDLSYVLGSCVPYLSSQSWSIVEQCSGPCPNVMCTVYAGAEPQLGKPPFAQNCQSGCNSFTPDGSIVVCTEGCVEATSCTATTVSWTSSYTQVPGGNFSPPARV
jgi:hypothetical protein